MNIKNILFRLLFILTLTPLLVACGSDDDDTIIYLPDNGNNNGGNNGGTPDDNNLSGEDSGVAGNSNCNTTATLTGTIPEVMRLEFPRIKKGTSVVIVHKTSDKYDPTGVNYCTEWDYELQSQRWSCYQMHAGYSLKGITRYQSDKDHRQYPGDEDLSTNYYTQVDNYTRSGFDHGHICPSADRLYSSRANYQTFYMTNMQPQYHVFNAGLWGEMENQVRVWTPTKTTDTLYVCKGGTIDGQTYDNKSGTLKYINDILLTPRFFYMALLLKNSQGYRAMAFWAENLNEDHSKDALPKYAISIDELERRTGIDFFCNLPDEVEKQVEASYLPILWGLQ